MNRKKVFVLLALLLIFGIIGSAFGQTPESPQKPSVVMGDVVSLDSSKIGLQAKDGPLEIVLNEKTEYKKVPPDNPVLKAAVPSAFSDIGVGDKLVISGIFSPDKKSLAARSVYLMSKSDLAQKAAKETGEWRTRGIAGRVAAVDAQAKKITVAISGMMGNTTNVTLTPKDNATILRYAPDSVKFADAKQSSISEIAVGDGVRAVGDKSADGLSFAAEKILSGAFQTRAGTVKTIDAAKNEVVITDLQTKKDLTIEIGTSSVLKKFPEEMAQRMAQFQMGAAGGFRPAGQAGAQAANSAPAGQGQAQSGAQRPGGFGGGGQRGGGGIDDMLDRFPNITAADLKPGDVIAVSSTKGNNIDRIKAIKLLAGVEPFLKAAQMAAAAQPGGQRGGSLDLNIPGLDGFGTP